MSLPLADAPKGFSNLSFQPHRLPRSSVLRWISLISVVMLTLAYLATHPSTKLPAWRNGSNAALEETIVLPIMLDQKTNARFDRLVKNGSIFYNETKPEFYNDSGFFFEFRIVTNQGKKPILAVDDPGRSQKTSGPFINVNQEEIITNISTHHRLMLNKYAIYRPMLVIPTTEFALQSEHLDASDINSAWTVLFHFPNFVIMYNCGPNSGSSQGHRHLQGIPHPAYKLWPNGAASTTDVAGRIERVPFRHFVLRLPPAASAAHVFAVYQHLLEVARWSLEDDGWRFEDYNLAFTKEWMAIIPRRATNHMYGANTAGMLGLVSVPDQASRALWAQLGYSRYLVELGVPFQPVSE